MQKLKLAEYNQKRVSGTFRGMFIRWGYNPKTQTRTALVIYVKDSNGNQLCDHVWININPFWDLYLEQGDWISFWGYVATYKKKHDEEVGFKHTSHVKVVRSAKSTREWKEQQRALQEAEPNFSSSVECEVV